MGFNCNLGNAFEVLGMWGHDDVNVLRPSDYSPGIHRQAADEDELDACLGEPAKQLIKGRLGQLRWAAPVNRIS